MSIGYCSSLHNDLFFFLNNLNYSNNNKHKASLKEKGLSQSHNEVGGLGIRALSEFNQALVVKQAWRILKSLYTLLRRYLRPNISPQMH